MARQLIGGEYQELQRMVRQEVEHAGRRVQIVSACVWCHSIPDVAAVFGVSQSTVCLWIHRFKAYDPTGPYGKERNGRPCKITREVNITLH